MKKAATSVYFSTSGAFAQGEWGDLKKNKLTMKEIPPVWPGCSGSIAEKDTCFNQQISKHIISNFTYPTQEYKKYSRPRGGNI